MKILFLYVILLYSLTLNAQTNCNKFPFYPADHIRNPSFEQVSNSCFTSLFAAQINTAVPFWHYPANPSPSVLYSGECNHFAFPYDPRQETPTTHITYLPFVPQPIPDGKGVISIYNGRTANGDTVSDMYAGKSYVANFLLRPLKKDSLYRLSFYLGFGVKDPLGVLSYSLSFSPMKISLYGTADSTRIPFPSPHGKPFNCLGMVSSAWILLGTRTISGNPGTWVKDSISFMAPQDMQVLAIGPACDFSDIPHPFMTNEAPDYYYLDYLQFYQSPTPSASIGISSGSLCDGPNASVTLQMKSATFYTGSQLQWYKNNMAVANATNRSITITKTQYGEGWYQCGVQNDSVCARSDSFHVMFEPYPGNIIGKNPDTTACNGDTVLLQVNGGTNSTYLWQDGSVSSIKEVAQSGAYSVQISNACAIVIASKTVNFKECPPVLYVPTGFTPNKDRLNDVFKATYFNGIIKSFSLSVYNRSGQRVFYSEDISKGWDGTINHNMQNPGVYTWLIHYTDGNDTSHAEKGTITLIR